MFKKKKTIIATRLSLFGTIAGIILALSSICSCSGETEANIVYDSIEAGHVIPGSGEILSQLKQCADIATTEVTIRKIAIYDSNSNEHFSWRNISTWKYGERKCIIPVEVKIKYGYDLAEMDIDNIKITDDSTAVVITLPKQKIVDAGYNTEIDRESVTSISTGLRSQIGHQLEEEIRRKGYEAILKEDISSLVGKEVEQNTRTLFESIIKALGFEHVQITTTTNKKE